MTSVIDRCSLDYLVGTLSTAYKGMITSLAAKDFCISEEAAVISLRGSVLSMPEGEYEASLIQNGIELDRTRLEQGFFRLQAGRDRILQAKNLQIDIIQAGKHIGTFLLKKESRDGIYISAVELSGELKDVDFKLLTVPLRNKVGLLQKAEGIITRILSTKKNWEELSESLAGFAGDFFWSDREAFYRAFGILVRFSRKAAERANVKASGKPVVNFLRCIEIPLERDPDDAAVRDAAALWLREQNASSVDLSAHVRRSAAVLKSIHDRFSPAGVGPGLGRLLESIRNKLISMPALGPSVFVHFRRYAATDHYAELARYGPQARSELAAKLAEAGNSLERRQFDEVFGFVSSLEPDLFNDAKMIEAFFNLISEQTGPRSAEAFSRALSELLSLVPVLSGEALALMKSNVPDFLEKLISLNRDDLCAALVDGVGRTESPLREEVVMTPSLAAAVLSSGSDALPSRYADILAGIIIPAAKVREISTETWAEVVNPLHLGRLANFMDILQLGDRRFRGILAHVTANLYISGVFIPDDRLFQRRVSAYLNSPAMDYAFLLNYLFLQKLPVYYNEVGAASRIRDYSTEIDSWGNDPVLYFVRKQVHVNASNYNVRLIETIIRSWAANEPALLRNAVPSDIYAGINAELFAHYSRVIRPFFESLGVLDAEGLHLERLLALRDDELRSERADGKPEEIATKVMLLCRLYREIVKKYSFSPIEPQPREDLVAGIRERLERMRRFERTFRNPEKTTPEESLYFKRHIAFGIPSVLGTYHEAKFDAFGEFLRHDGEIRVLLEKIAAQMEARGPDSTISGAASRLEGAVASYRALALHGVPNFQIEEIAAMIEQNGLRFSQLRDLLKMWQKELGWIVEQFTRTFQQPVTDILSAFPGNDLPEHLMHLDRSEQDFLNKAADIVIRDMLADIPGLVEADRIIERLLAAVENRIEESDIVINPEIPREGKAFFAIQEMNDREAMRRASVLGGKAKNLVYLHNRGFRVPEGVVLPVLPGGPDREGRESPSEVLRQAVRSLEKRTGLLFGDPDKPLFLSVRSGSYVSMPGILSSILFCGMNPRTMRGLINRTGDRRLGLDSCRRFMEQYATTVLGLDIGLFEGLRNEVREMELLIKLYERELERRGLSIPEDAYEQLRESVRAVSASWRGRRAEQFRRATKTSPHWGTSVTLMQMVFGNAAASGASVFFTRNPFTLEEEISGETRELATGDDLVYGRQLNRSISRKQIPEDAGKRVRMMPSLEESDLELYRLHAELGRKIERAMGGLPQEVEVTYAGQPDGNRVLFVLQTRRMEPGVVHAAEFDEVCAMESRITGRGIGAHGGAISGVASFAQSPEQAVWLARNRNLPVVLLRKTASTDDISLMPFIGGMVTSSGGITSHAAVLAQKFGITAVVGCSGLHIRQDEQGARYAEINGNIIREGSAISIDGARGLVFSGVCFHVSRPGAGP